MFHFLLYVVKKLSSLNFREKRTSLNRISNLARINLTHTLGALTSHSQATVCLSFRFMDRATLPDYRAPTSSLIVVVVALHCLIGHQPRPTSILFILSLRESGSYVHLPSRLVTRLAAYHIYGMWLVLSNA